MKKLILSSVLALTVCSVSNAQSVSQPALFLDNVNIGADQTVDIVIRDGRIRNIGGDLEAPANAQKQSGEDLWVTSGMFAPLTSIGLVEIGAESSTDDRRAEDARTTVSLMAADGFNPQSPIIDNTRVSGVTHVGVIGSPSQNIFAGTGFIANTSGEFDSVENDAAFVYVQLGSRGGKLAGGSRPAAIAQLRNAFSDAKNFGSRFGGPDDGDALRRRDAAALQSALRGQTPVIIGANRASDLLKVIELKKEFGVDFIISGGAEAWMVAPQLKSADMRLIIDPVANLPSSFDVVGSRIDNAKLLADAGVDFAFMSFSESTSHNVRVLNQHAGNAVANGVSWDKAMAAITSVPASWFGVNVGQVARGSDTFVVWDGDPLQVTSAPTMIMIDGKVQSLNSRQRELRDRYNPTRDETRAHKYR